jgi:hypothetical protein
MTRRRRPSLPPFANSGFHFLGFRAAPLRRPGALDLRDGRSPIADLGFEDLADFLLHGAVIPFGFCLERLNHRCRGISDR